MYLLRIAALVVTTHLVVGEVVTVGNNMVVKPGDAQGPEVAVILIPGAYLTNDQYAAFGEALSKSSSYKLWVGLVGGFLEDLPNPLQLSTHIRDCMDALFFSGMDTSTVFLAGHSLGGTLLESYGKEPELELHGIVLLGSYFSSNAVIDYPLPFLTLSGDLDGQTRITKIEQSFREYEALLPTNETLKHLKPVVVLEDVNHAHYATGEMPSLVQENDIHSPLSKEEGQEKLSVVIDAFLVSVLGDLADQIDSAHQVLDNAYMDTKAKIKPFGDMYRLEEYPDGSGSPWTERAQEQIVNLAHEIQWSRLAPWDHLHGSIVFPTTKPKLDFNGEVIHMETHTHETGVLIDVGGYVSTLEIASKMMSQSSIKLTMADLNLEFLDPISCADINQLGLDLVMNMATDLVKDRYTTRGRPIQFMPDTVLAEEAYWNEGSIEYTQTETGLEVRSAFYTQMEVEDPLNGYHYCRLMSPSRMMEYIMVDSLQHTEPAH